MNRAARAVEYALALTLGIAMAITAIWVDPDAFELIRQVEEVDFDGGQRRQLLAYAVAIYAAFALPVGVVVGALAALATGPALSPRAVRAVAIGRRLLIALGLIPLAMAARGYLAETADDIAYTPAESTADRGMNVVLIVIDTLRADHLGAYGHRWDTSPNLDALAAEGALFERCHTAASWTKPSVASILTSTWPGSHNANQFQRQLPEAATTLGEAMRDAGFVTYGYVTNPNLKGIFQFDQGFEFYDDFLLRDHLYLAALRDLPFVSGFLKEQTGRRFNFRDGDNSAVANSRILPWLERYADQDLFMYLHYMDPHRPYAPPPPYDTMFPGKDSGDRQTRTALYDGEIRFLDTQLGALFDRFKELGIYDRTLFVITSDHGEAFGEHNDWEHDHTVYQEQIHAPLILRHGDLGGGARIDTAVRSVDIAPTILDLAGVPAPEVMEGRSLVPLIAGDQEDADVFVDHYAAQSDYRLQSLIREGRWKYIRTLESKLRDVRALGPDELYDIVADPHETRNLAREHPEVVDDLRNRVDALAAWSASRALDPDAIQELDEGTMEQLRLLGYVE